MSERFLLKIDPPQPCLYSDEDGQPCERVTAYAEASGDAPGSPSELSVAPYCWQHLELCIPPWLEHPTLEEVAWERFCIANFIVGHYGGVGAAEVRGACPLESVPLPYEEITEADYDTPEEKACFRRLHGTDQAYYATYRDEQGESRHVCAVWLADFLYWELYEFPREVSHAAAE